MARTIRTSTGNKSAVRQARKADRQRREARRQRG